MPTVREQITLENEFAESSANKYYSAQDKLRSKRQNEQTDSSRYIMQQGILEASKVLQSIVETKKRGISAKYNGLVKLVASRVTDKGELYYDYNSVIYLAMSVLFQSLGNKQNTKFTYLKEKLATVLEADAKARLFEAAYPGYYFTVMKSMQEQGVKQYQHLHKVIMTKFRHFELEWNSWNIYEINAVSQKIYNAILVAMPNIFFKHTYKIRNKSTTIIDTTVEADEWFAKYEKERGLINPSLPPMIIEPLPWSADDNGNITGGYVTPRMCTAVPFVKAYSDTHKEFIRNNVPRQHISALNKMQGTAWRINAKILDVQKAMFKAGKGGIGIPRFTPLPLIPYPEHLSKIAVENLTELQQKEVLEWKIVTKQLHTENRLNKSKVIAYKMTFDGACDYAGKELYFVYNTDFRGRVYCATSGLSPQGNDTAKSLLTFSTGVPLGADGMKWLAIHGANTYGNDKISNRNRVQWVQSMEATFRSIADRPLDTTQYWEGADKPWQFLAFIFEWAKADFGKDLSFVSQLPIGLDGSCNGIQHYSAILRDRVGGSGVNLINTETPMDIYQDVANELINMLKRRSSIEPKAQLWLTLNITRKLTKRPVMTLPYGSTQNSAKRYVLEWLQDNTQLPLPQSIVLSSYLTPVLWEAIGNVVIASRIAMTWLQTQSSKILRESGKPLQWLSPTGFPVFQPYYKMAKIVIDSMMMGDILVSDNTYQNNARVRSSYNIETADIDNTRQRSGIAPNFIHSIDASHMVKTINACDDRIKHFAMIHDDFGTHAGNTQYLWEVIREEFHTMYTEHEPLKDWYEQQEVKKRVDMPPMGDLDIGSVLTSMYFFG